MSVALPSSIPLKDDEKALFDVLLAFIASHEHTQHVILRAVGGWIRDKILNRDSNDIDIVVDGMNGVQFAEEIKNWIATQPHLNVDHEDPVDKPRKASKTKVGVVAKRDELNKHVTTAIVHIIGFDVDILNFRGYDPSSSSNLDPASLPEIENTLLAQDAHLRDFTINALYYNINKAIVEDPTNGIQDLSAGIIRCPGWIGGGAKGRLSDDPLRCVRSVRFASRFGFVLDPEIVNQAKNSLEIRGSFLIPVPPERALSSSSSKKAANAPKVIGQSSISPERVVKELDQVFVSPNVLHSLELIKEIDLAPLVFPPVHEVNHCWNRIDVSHSIQVVKNIIEEFGLTEERYQEIQVSKKVALYTGFLSIVHHSVPETPPFTRYWIKDAWRFQKNDAAQIVDLMEYSVKIKEFVNTLHTNSSASSSSLANEQDRLELHVGRLLRQAGAQWVLALSIARTIEQIQADPTLESPEMVSDKYQRFVAFVKEKGLLEPVPIWKVELFFTGTDLIKNFGAKPGKQLGVYLEKIFDWQILNPGKYKEDCRAWIAQTLFGSSS